MAKTLKKTLTSVQQKALLHTLQLRFEKNMHRHKNITWDKVQVRLANNTDKLWSLQEMEQTGGEPDVVGVDAVTGKYIFYDCAIESPIGRRSICYDFEGLQSRKEFKPVHNAVDMATEMGITLLTEEEYHALQKLGNVDHKTSSWLQTPVTVKKLGGAIFGDFRFGKVFVYHNGAQSYYGGRGFRGSLRV
jgi:hypothetical protein